MSISPKIWIPALTIGGAGGIIGLPIYFSQTQNSGISSVKPQHQMPSTSLTKVESVDSVPESKKSFAKGECAIISLPENLGQFLQGQHKNKGDYVSTSCKNTGVKNDYIPLPKDWTGLFPSLVLAGNLKQKVGEKLEIITESKQEEGRFGSSIKMILSGKGLKSPVKGTREEVEEKTLKNTVISVSIEEGKFKDQAIYLLLDSNQNNS